ncbi:DUF1196 domain-containing protein, partial [Vibrio cholerae]|nr:DUF1196 domain-containing protein [Vibrio cholerae]MVB87389.1 DUF1196 domain-containing protein [Vibrio cholerae]MVB98389.1 DUF1196 domain-containing protein [Vibrio cholerae]MVC09741.1 DUF1196 domain-containing protein [Vibrio cholerae]MVC61830.1 DUF1196 domain-containing protein [Vibrio cholerae]
ALTVPLEAFVSCVLSMK